MKTYINVFLKSQNPSPDYCIEVLRKFSNSMSNWSFLEEESRKYSQLRRKPSCLLTMRMENESYARIAITSQDKSIFSITNILFEPSDSTTVDEYNRIAFAFVKDFKSYLKKECINIHVRATSETIELRDIITGNKLRELFERYLSAFPASYHPLDIERLDLFICSLAKYEWH